jgi:hypothetical protein
MPAIGAVMARKKMGRPKTSNRDDVSIKFDRVLARRAKAVADGKRTSMAEYLSELARGAIDRDYAQLMRELDESGK